MKKLWTEEMADDIYKLSPVTEKAEYTQVIMPVEIEDEVDWEKYDEQHLKAVANMIAGRSKGIT